jgi:hypothetical protein
MNVQYETLIYRLESLGLNFMAAGLESFLSETHRQDQTLVNVIADLIEIEYIPRKERSTKSRLKLSGMPVLKRLEDFDRLWLKGGITERQFEELSSAPGHRLPALGTAVVVALAGHAHPERVIAFPIFIGTGLRKDFTGFVNGGAHVAQMIGQIEAAPEAGLRCAPILARFAKGSDGFGGGFTGQIVIHCYFDCIAKGKLVVGQAKVMGARGIARTRHPINHCPVFVFDLPIVSDVGVKRGCIAEADGNLGGILMKHLTIDDQIGFIIYRPGFGRGFATFGVPALGGDKFSSVHR